MPDDALLAETNHLLQRLLDLDADRKASTAAAKEKFDAMKTKMNADREETMRKRLEAEGLSAEDAAIPEEEWEARRKEAQRRSQENIETARMKDAEYKQTLLEELRTQSDLLRRIEERLAR